LRSESAVAPVDRAIRAVLVLVAVGAALYLALALYFDWTPVRASIAALGALALAAGVLLASLNYLLRFARWRDLLRAMGQQVPVTENLCIYLGGLALTATPGKLGETIRSALLLRWRVPLGASLAAFFIDRLTDLVGVLLLAALSGAGYLWWVLAAAAFGIGIAMRQAFGTRRAESLARWLDRHHRLASLVTLLRSGMRHYIAAWRMPRLLAYVALAVAAYGIQGVVFAAYVDRLWPDAEWLASMHIFATSTLAGAASMIPGGLG
jgi:glycosyltransferase 2 family protein